ncbi:MAG: neutral zinc metallopeptidase [Thermoanaerobaculia bacterium]
MLWRGRRRSGNVEDRRGMGPVLIGGGGVGAIVIALLVVLFGGDPSEVLQTTPPASSESSSASPSDPQAEMVSVVLADTEDVWSQVFREEIGQPYREPKLVLFDGAVASACGTESSATGPFYCPRDEKVYLDLSFFRELARFGAPGDFAQAYVVAHEVGHHVQNLLGISDQVREARASANEAEANGLSVRMELQADCLAGVWGNRAQKMKGILDSHDLQEALDAASSIGDDRLQNQSRGYAVPESFTHGSSEQRVRWFRRGFDSGNISNCDTFNSSFR